MLEGPLIVDDKLLAVIRSEWNESNRCVFHDILLKIELGILHNNNPSSLGHLIRLFVCYGTQPPVTIICFNYYITPYKRSQDGVRISFLSIP